MCTLFFISKLRLAAWPGLGSRLYYSLDSSLVLVADFVTAIAAPKFISSSIFRSEVLESEFESIVAVQEQAFRRSMLCRATSRVHSNLPSYTRPFHGGPLIIVHALSFIYAKDLTVDTALTCHSEEKNLYKNICNSTLLFLLASIIVNDIKPILSLLFF